MILTTILLFLILAAFIVVVFHIICWLVSWGESVNRDTLYIKYSDFKKSYDINPNKWGLNYSYVYFKKESNSYYGNQTIFQFYPIGYYRYRFWRNSLERKQRKANKKATRQEVMSIIKSDIQSSNRPSIEIDLKGKDKNKVIEKIVKYFKEDLGMEVKITDKEQENENS